MVETLIHLNAKKADADLENKHLLYLTPHHVSKKLETDTTPSIFGVK